MLRRCCAPALGAATLATTRHGFRLRYAAMSGEGAHICRGGARGDSVRRARDAQAYKISRVERVRQRPRYSSRYVAAPCQMLSHAARRHVRCSKRAVL